ncbi:MAG: hypothetical protein KGK17_05915 [Betaproteobacteria bacterium]|nr:hypothetical protein [Betaproteobacteria bacterium]
MTDNMSLVDTFRSHTALSRFWMGLALVCLLGAQISGFAHRVAHGDRLAQISQTASQETPWAHDDHNCQLFDALMLASFTGTAASLPTVMVLPKTILVSNQLPIIHPNEPLGFQTRAPPVPSQQT